MPRFSQRLGHSAHIRALGKDTTLWYVLRNSISRSHGYFLSCRACMSCRLGGSSLVGRALPACGIWRIRCDMSATSRRILFGSGQALGRLFNIQRWKAPADDDAFQSTQHIFPKSPSLVSIPLVEASAMTAGSREERDRESLRAPCWFSFSMGSALPVASHALAHDTSRRS